MATQAQITANRLNSLKSTGPRTEEGKAASSANSLKHGLTAVKVFPAARQEEYDSLAHGLREQLEPATPEQERLLEIMIHASWNLQRLQELHEDLWHTLTQAEDGEPKTMAQAFLDDCKGPKSIDKLYRYMRDLERSYDRARRQFASAGPAQTKPQSKLQLKPQTLSVPKPALPDPVQAGDFGFVSSARLTTAPTPVPGSRRDRYTIHADEPPAVRL
jgi:hypothetical protein